MYNKILNYSLKNGKIKFAENLIIEMIEKNKIDIISINSLMNYYLKNGEIKKSEETYKLIKPLDLNPDIVTFTGLINYYLNTQNDLEKANEVLKTLEIYQIRPTPQTFVCYLQYFLNKNDIIRSIDVLNQIQKQYRDSLLKSKELYLILTTLFLKYYIKNNERMNINFILNRILIKLNHNEKKRNERKKIVLKLYKLNGKTSDLKKFNIQNHITNNDTLFHFFNFYNDHTTFFSIITISLFIEYYLNCNFFKKSFYLLKFLIIFNIIPSLYIFKNFFNYFLFNFSKKFHFNNNFNININNNNNNNNIEFNNFNNINNKNIEFNNNYNNKNKLNNELNNEFNNNNNKLNIENNFEKLLNLNKNKIKFEFRKIENLEKEFKKLIKNKNLNNFLINNKYNKKDLNILFSKYKINNNKELKDLTVNLENIKSQKKLILILKKINIFLIFYFFSKNIEKNNNPMNFLFDHLIHFFLIQNNNLILAKYYFDLMLNFDIVPNPSILNYFIFYFFINNDLVNSSFFFKLFDTFGLKKSSNDLFLHFSSIKFNIK
jgi:pentatricopeptide repeat protein